MNNPNDIEMSDRQATFDYCAEVAEYHAKQNCGVYQQHNCATEIAREIRAASKKIVLETFGGE